MKEPLDDDHKYKKFYIEWWNIRKSTIYMIVALVILGSIVTGLWFWASKHDWFLAAQQADVPENSAKIVSFEGDVRVTRAATRETIVVTRDTYLAPGDRIQRQAE